MPLPAAIAIIALILVLLAAAVATPILYSILQGLYNYPYSLLSNESFNLGVS